jgi:hypothetical protein
VYRRRYFGVLEEEDFEGEDGSEEEASVARSVGEEPSRATGLVARSEGEDAARATGKVPRANLSEVLHAGYKAAMEGKEPSVQLKAGVVAEARHLVLSNGEGGELAKRVGEGGDGEAFDS